MSEEILKALMQLFALAVKQDGGIPARERAWVMNFLNSNLSQATASKYMLLFDQHAGPLTETEPVNSSAFPSVKDSLRILNICESIGRTLTQEQKVVALIRLYELVNAGHQFTPQRINILNTVAEVFRISSEEFTSIEKFIRDDDQLRQNKSVLFLEQRNGGFKPVIKLHNGQATSLIILHVPATDLWFLRYVSEEQTYLNEMPLRHGPVYALNRSSSVRTSKGTILSFSEITSFYKNEKHVHGFSLSSENIVYKGAEPLNRINFTAHSGKITGVFGTEQSGKSVLLKVLHGILSPQSGTIRINGEERAKLNNPQSVSGFVPSVPMYFSRLTVNENLRYALSGFETGTEHISSIVKRAVDEAGLTTKINTRAGMLSREQSARLKIAMEAVRDPSVLFVDDPFRGLAPGEAFPLMCYLRDLSRRGKIVIVSTGRNYPEVFNVFDEVVFLDNGYLVYQGLPSDAVEHFRMHGNFTEPVCPSCGNYNPDTIFRILEAPAFDELGSKSEERMITPERWAALYTPAEKNGHLKPSKEKVEGKFRKKDQKGQLMAFALTEVRRKTASFSHYFLLILLAFAAGALSSVASDMSRTASGYSDFGMLLVAAIALGFIFGATEYSADRNYLLRNNILKLSRPAFFMVKTIFILAFSAALVFLLLIGGNIVLIVHSMFANWLLLSVSCSAIALAVYAAASLRR